jgi:hypothetical protein
MNKRWLFVLVPPAIVLFIWLGGELVMHLWNWLLPSLFGWKQISFWQGLGLLALCRILFGGFGNHGSRGPRSRWSKAGGWEKMTPEDREKFRQDMRTRCGDLGASGGGGAKEPA